MHLACRTSYVGAGVGGSGRSTFCWWLVGSVVEAINNFLAYCNLNHSASSSFRAPLLGSVWLAAATQGGRGRASQPRRASQPALPASQTGPAIIITHPARPPTLASKQPACFFLAASPLQHAADTLRVATCTQSYPARNGTVARTPYVRDTVPF